MKNHSLLIFALVGSIGLAACSKGGEEAQQNTSETAAANEVVAPLPMIGKSEIYRCADSSVVYVDYFTDNVTANVRIGQDGKPTKLVAPAVGEPFVAEGYSLKSTEAGIAFASPEKPEQTCKG